MEGNNPNYSVDIWDQMTEFERKSRADKALIATIKDKLEKYENPEKVAEYMYYNLTTDDRRKIRQMAIKQQNGDFLDKYAMEILKYYNIR